MKRVALTAVAVALAASAGLHAAAASSRTFVVNTTTDALDARVGDGVCATGVGLCSLRAAVQETNALPGADVIEVPAGTYAIGMPALNQNGITSGDLNITDSLAINGAGAGATIVDGGAPPTGTTAAAPGLDRLFEVAVDGGSVTFSGLTLSDGYAAEYGGAIFNNSTATVTVEASTLTGNVAGKSGGAIDNHVDGRVEVLRSTLSRNFAYESGSAINNNRDGVLEVIDSTVSANSAAAVGLDELLMGAGAISNNAELDTAGSITVTRSQISDNRSGGGRSGAAISNDGTGTVVVDGTAFSKNVASANGGAIFNGSGGVSVADSRFTENAATNGGAIYSTADKGGHVTVRESTFVLNSASGDGGAIVGTGTGHLEVLDSTFSKNDADDWGGAVMNANKGSTTIQRSSFSENSGLSGGGFANEGAGLVVVENTTFTKNAAFDTILLAGGEGGGMHTNSGGEVEVSGGAFTDNQATGGGGFSNAGGGTVAITGTRFAGNTADEHGGGLLIESGAVRMLNIDVVGNVAGGAEEAGGGISYAGDKAVGIGETAAIERSRIRDNKAKGPGGGIDSRGDGPLAITTTSITGNTATTGGAVHHVGDAPLDVRRSTLSANFAESGGGLFFDGDGEATLENTTVSSNRAGQFGGGLLVSSRVNLRNSTIASNTAASGGGINNGGGDLVGDGSVLLANTIVANSPTGGNCTGTMTSLGGNLESANSCQFREISDQPGTDPRLGPLAANGGPTETHALLAGSPAQETAVCTEAQPCPPVDQRGVERPRFDGFDIGAYESELTPGGGGTQRCAGMTERPVPADFDSWISQSAAAANFGNDSILKVESQGGGNERALVHFDLPPIPPGCKLISATLRLYAASATEGRTLEAVRIASDWNELGVNWGSQPPTDGPAATAPSGLETLEWDVLAQTLGMYAHGEHGLLIRDRAENESGAQSFHSGEKGPEHPPQLVLVFDDPDAPPMPGTCPTTPQVLSADRDSWVSEGSPANNFGSDSTLKVKSQAGANARALIRFPLPILPSGCTSIASASLRIEASSAKEGRTLEALRVASAWTESGMTWSNQPAGTGPAATTPSAQGPLEWAVTAQLLGMYTSANHGFLIRDAQENGVGDEQTLDSRHKITDSPPQLVLVFDDTTPETVIDSGPMSPTDSSVARFVFSSDRADASFECSLDGAAFAACSSPYAAEGLTEGDHRFEVRATRRVRAVDPTPATYEWKVAIPPETTIDSGPDSPSASPDATLTFSADDREATFECSLNGAPFVTCSSPVEYANLADGPNELRVRATDALGNMEPVPAGHSWTVAVPPETTIDSGPPALGNSTSAGFTFSGVDNGPAPVPLEFECKLDTRDWAACTSPQDYADLADGEHSLHVRATDAGGNTDATPATSDWTIDTVAPEATINSGPPDLTNTTTATFVLSATEPADLECRLDTGDWTACTSPQDYRDLADGQHIFAARATDRAGNTGLAATYAWTIDTIAPQTTIARGPGETTNSTAASFEFTADEPASLECRLDTGDWTACTSPYELAGPLADGDHELHVRATDTAGSTGAEATYAWTIDTIAPRTTITAGPADPTKESAASFAFTADETASFECRLDTGDWTACTSPQGYADLAEGLHTFDVRASDRAGNVGDAASSSWRIDTTAPVTTITAGPPALTNRTSATFDFSADETASFECRLDTGAWTSCTSPQSYGDLGDGRHVLEIRATDEAGNTGQPASSTWTIDTIAPITTITSGPREMTNSTAASFAFAADEAASFECRLDDADWTACTSPRLYFDLSAGRHTVQVRATDDAGNIGLAATYGWTIDTHAPATTITAGPAALTNRTSVSFAFSADETAGFECRLDAGGWAPCTSPYELAGPLADGDHTFEVHATDPAGNTGQAATYSWTIDTVAPVTTITAGPPASPFVFHASEPARFECRLDGGDWMPCTSPHAYPDLLDGPHTVEIRATDDAGNTGPAASHAWTIDTSAPDTTITSGPPALTNRTTATFTFVANQPVEFECRLDAGDWMPCTSPQTYLELEDGEHTVEIRATDEAGNPESEPGAYTWTIDTSAPTTTIRSGPPTDANSSSASFDFDADEPASFECRLDGGDWRACESPVHYADLRDGEHAVEIRATDRAGNIELTPAVHAWQIDTVVPQTQIDEQPAATTEATTARFRFSADEAGSAFECSLDGEMFAACTSPREYHELAPGSHEFRVQARDRAGNGDESPASYRWTITIPPPPDTTAPETTLTTKPPDPTASGSARFEFTGTDDTTPQSELRFECRLDSEVAADCSSPSLYSGLSDGTHTFEVRAVDLAGNADPTHATYTWTVDTTAPQTTITDGPPATTAQTSAQFSFEADEPGSHFECALDGGAWAACASPLRYDALGAGAHEFSVRATDRAGNVDPTPATHRWTVDTAAPQTTITGAPPATTSSTSARFTFTADESGSRFECALDGAAPTPCTSPRDYSGLTAGAHQFSVRAIDPAGNTDPTPASHSWTISTAPACGQTATAAAAADAWIDENSPTANKGSDSILKVQSKGPSDNFRALVRFSLPAVPSGCAVQSATLRLNAASSKPGRTLHALRLASAWTENQVSWVSQLLTTGSPAATTSGLGYREWSVTTQVQAMYEGPNHGFLIRDAVEGQDAEQQFHSREKGENPPQLVIRFAAAAG